MPENESDPPQFNPTTSRDAGMGRRVAAEHSSNNRLISFRAASTVPLVPPLDCSVMPTSGPECPPCEPR